MRSNSAGFGSAYVVSFNQARPHQGLGQRIPKPPVPAPASLNQSNQVSAELVLGGFHHDDHRAAETGGVVFAEMSERYLTACTSISRCSYMLVFPLTDKEKTPYFCLIAQISMGRRLKQRVVGSRLCGTPFWFFGSDVPNSQHRPCLPPFPVFCPAASRCCTALLCYACGVLMSPAAHSGSSASLPRTC